jgi:hypothetical protein
MWLLICPASLQTVLKHLSITRHFKIKLANIKINMHVKGCGKEIKNALKCCKGERVEENKTVCEV